MLYVYYLLAIEGKQNDTHFDFDTLHAQLAIPYFKRLEQADTRRSNTSYSISDICKSGFAVYSLKSSSLLDFRPKTPAERANLKACFNLHRIPSNKGLRKALDGVEALTMSSYSVR